MFSHSPTYLLKSKSYVAVIHIHYHPQDNLTDPWHGATVGHYLYPQVSHSPERCCSDKFLVSPFGFLHLISSHSNGKCSRDIMEGWRHKTVSLLLCYFCLFVYSFGFCKRFTYSQKEQLTGNNEWRKEPLTLKYWTHPLSLPPTGFFLSTCDFLRGLRVSVEKIWRDYYSIFPLPNSSLLSSQYAPPPVFWAPRG